MKLPLLEMNKSNFLDTIDIYAFDLLKYLCVKRKADLKK